MSVELVCISCAHRADRRARLLRRMDSLGLKAALGFHLVQKDTEDPRRGCFASHVAVARAALADPRRAFTLVLEDDAVPAPDFDLGAALEHCAQARAELLYLGLDAQRAGPWEGPVRRVAGQLTHAYLLSRAGAARLAGLEYRGAEIDLELMEACGLHSRGFASSWLCYGYRRPDFVQDPGSASDLADYPVPQPAKGLARWLGDLWVFDVEPCDMHPGFRDHLRLVLAGLLLLQPSRPLALVLAALLTLR